MIAVTPGSASSTSAQARAPASSVKLPANASRSGRHRQPRRGHRFDEADEAPVSGGHVLWARDVRDARVTELEDVLDREPDALGVVDQRRRDPLVLETAVDEHDRADASSAAASGSTSSRAVAEMKPSTWRASIVSIWPRSRAASLSVLTSSCV